MNRTRLLGSSALRSFALVGAAFAFTATAQAQEVASEQDNPQALQTEAEIESGQDTSVTQGEGIVVTGSRIRRPNLESAVPILSVGGEEFFQTGQTAVGDVLNELPALRSTFSQSNAGQFLGTTGLNLLDLRGLGPQRTLTLVNGRRHVAADILNNAVSVDVNTIPADLIERVDVVTGGNSAIYGSDAIAGVVNFILRRDFEGFQARAQGGISKYGDAGSYTVAGMAGRNFGDGRGNIVAHLEYAHTDKYYGSARPFIARNDGFIQVDSDPAGSPNGSDGIPDRVFFRDIRGSTISSAGMFSIAQSTANARCGLGFNAPAATSAYNCNYIFDQSGTVLSPQTGGRVGLGPNGSFIGGNGPTNREANLLTLLPDYDRYSANLLGHFTISEALEPFIEAKFSKTHSYGRSGGPAFVQGRTIDADRERIRLDNPYLSAQARATLTDAILTAGVHPDSQNGTRPALTAAQRAAIADGSFRVPFRKNFLDLGVRNEDIQRETYRIVGGVRGTFNDDWGYEVSVNYGKFKERNKIEGNINYNRFLLALDAARDPATGQIVCRSRFDPSARIDVVETPESAARLAEDVAACVPFNPFGVNVNTDAVRDYILADTIANASLDQLIINGFVSGDSSQLFELPGGPVGFAIGAEYRREKTFYDADPIAEAGLTFYNAIPTFGPVKFEVKELFGELRLPVLANVPFFHELTVSGAGRVADYPGGAGTVFAYNAGVEWAPVRDLRLRANYSRAVRAPNVTETAAPLSQNFAPGFVDPCRPSSIGSGSQYRAANCQADLGPLFAGYDMPTAYSLEILSGSNPDLKSEKSNSWTIGGVFQPSFAPGLSLSVDYFDITVDDVIVAVSAQSIVNTCYDLPTLDNQFCALFDRYRGAGTGPNNEVPGQILQQNMEVLPLNFASYKARGIDAELGYRKNVEGLGTLSTRFVYTHNFQRSNFTNPADPTFENRILSELGTPQDEFLWNIDLATGPLTLGYSLRYIGKQVTNAYEDFFSLQGRPPQDADWADTIWYPSVVYHDVRVGYDVNDDYNFYLGVDNVANKKPPFGLTGTGDGSGIYSTRGRFFYAGVTTKF